MKTLLGEKAFELLKKYGIPVVEYKYVYDAEQASKLKVPCVLKVPSVSHKTEKGAVVVVHNKENMVDAWRKLSRQGRVMWQPFREGREVIIGLEKDPTFGRVVMVGMGGIFTESFKDVSFRAAPIATKDAVKMISELKGYEVLAGTRGQKSVSFRLLKKVLASVSKMKENIEELDINPFIIDQKSGCVVDARIVLAS